MIRFGHSIRISQVTSMLFLSGVAWMLVASPAVAAPQPATLAQGYGQMYNLNFPAAHRSFADWEKSHPADPMGPASDAAAFLFAEFDRLHVLQSEFFTEDDRFIARQRNLAPDPAAKRDFDAALARARGLVSAALARDPKDENAMLANVLCMGLHSDYLFLIEKRNFTALSEAKQGRKVAQNLLAAYPDCYDAYLAVGIENYLLSLKPIAVRWLLQLGGAQTDQQTGIKLLRITAEKGLYFKPYARLLLAVAALRDKDIATARRDLASLAAEFPNNRLYREELSKLK
jgi:hypothetical protein